MTHYEDATSGQAARPGEEAARDQDIAGETGVLAEAGAATRQASSQAARASGERQFLPYIHRIRGLAILLIVAAHTWYAFAWNDETIVTRAAVGVLENGTLIFVFIAGFLFRHLSARYTASSYYLSKLRNVILPYILVSVPAILYVLAGRYQQPYFPERLFDWNTAAQIGWLYLTGGHLTPLWFIPVMALFYLIGPLLIRADRDGRVYALLPVLYLLALFLHRPAYNQGLLHSFFFLLPIYLLGMWCAPRVEQVQAFVARYWPSLLATWIALAAAQTVFLSEPGNSYTDFFFAEHPDVISVQMLRKTIAVFLLMFVMRRFDGRPMPVLDFLGSWSFSLYFLHYYFVVATWIALRKLELTMQGSALAYVPYTAAVLAGCMALIWTTKRALGARSKYLIGA